MKKDDDEEKEKNDAREAYSQSHATDSPTAPVNGMSATTVSLTLDFVAQAREEAARDRNHLAYLRDAIAREVGYTLTGNADEDDAQLIDRVAEYAQRAPCTQCGTRTSSDGDWYRLCGPCRWAE